MTYPLVEIWICLTIAGLMGVLAGWLLWGRRTKRIVASYRGRLAKLRTNWETVEDRLAEALERASALERERDRKHAELDRIRNDFEHVFHEKENAWREEIHFLEDRLRQLNELIEAADPSRPPQPSVTDVVPTSRPGKPLSRPG